MGFGVKRVILRNDTQTHKYLKTLPNSEPRWRDRSFTPLDCSSLRVTWCPPGKRYEQDERSRRAHPGMHIQVLREMGDTTQGAGMERSWAIAHYNSDAARLS